MGSGTGKKLTCLIFFAASFIFSCRQHGILLGQAASGPLRIRQIKDVPYIADGLYKHQLDLYLPDGQDGFPLLVFVHGGGWRWGDRRLLIDIYGDMGRAMAARGIGVAVISYRLAPDYTIKDELSDVASATAWAWHHARDYGADPHKIILAGHSAGGHLAAMIAFDPEWLQRTGLHPRIIRGLILWSGLYDVRDGVANAFFTTRHRVWYTVFGKRPSDWEKMSPISYVNGPVPGSFNILLLYAERDFDSIRRQTSSLAQRIKQRWPQTGLKVLELPGEGHLSEIFRADNPDAPAFREIVSFVDSIP